MKVFLMWLGCLYKNWAFFQNFVIQGPNYNTMRLENTEGDFSTMFERFILV